MTKKIIVGLLYQYMADISCITFEFFLISRLLGVVSKKYANKGNFYQMDRDKIFSQCGVISKAKENMNPSDQLNR